LKKLSRPAGRMGVGDSRDQKMGKKLGPTQRYTGSRRQAAVEGALNEKKPNRSDQPLVSTGERWWKGGPGRRRTGPPQMGGTPVPTSSRTLGRKCPTLELLKKEEKNRGPPRRKRVLSTRTSPVHKMKKKLQRGSG